jgi:hypothetical protein
MYNMDDCLNGPDKCALSSPPPPGLAPHLCQVLGLPLGELVPVAQLGHAGPHILAGRAQQLEDVQQLLQLAVAGEDGLLRRQGNAEQAQVNTHMVGLPVPT